VRGTRGGALGRGATSHGPRHPAPRSHASVPHRATPTPPGARRPATSAPSLPDLIGGYIPLPLPVPDWSKPIIAALLLLCLAFGLRAQVTSRRARRLEHTQQALTQDIGAMQCALVPEIPPRRGALVLSVAYRPADGPAAGGDFYDAFELADGRVVIILGDVSGHGRAALAHAARMRYTLRAYAEAGLAPREVLQLAGRAIGISGDGLYTTVVIAVHDGSAGSLTYASAGHPPPLFLGQSAHEPLTHCASPPLGWGMPSGRRQTTVPFTDGARACLFSDGLIEARADHDLLGRERLSRMLAELGSEPSAGALLDRVGDFASQVRDDMAACIIEATDGSGGAVNETWLEELELDLDLLNLGQGNRFLTACGLTIPETGLALTRIRAVVAEYGTGVLTVTLPEHTCTAMPPTTPTFAPTTAPPLNPVPVTPRFSSVAS
jgi:serine phosphatase RsbU (regulator of sigma subunit)